MKTEPDVQRTVTDRETECSILQDLMPLYQDDVLSEKTRKFVEKHLDTCDGCREKYNAVSRETVECLADSKENIEELSRKSFRKFTGRLKRQKIIYAVIAVIIAFLLFTGIYRFIIVSNNKARISKDGMYTYTDLGADGIMVTGYLGNEAVITIPETIDGHRVTGIGSGGFSYNDQLTEVTISKYINRINPASFDRCENLEIKVDPENRFFEVVDKVLFTEDLTKLVLYPLSGADESYIVPDGVTEIEEYAFYGNLHLKEISIPESVEKIGGNAFAYCRALEEISIPSRIINISDHTFAGCGKLRSIILPEKLKVIGYGAFMGCTQLEELQIPDGTFEIGSMAFGMCSSLQRVTVPDSMTSISSSAFYECSSSLTITCSPESYAAGYAEENNIPCTNPEEKDGH
ncbi:MAG: leucine-rich repeat protein [Parasporobacterium sp.]|nr:leucine-rich repeat protein [Parasporobacterium sp.]